MKILNVVATSRLSFGIYNNKQEIDYFIDALIKCNNFFRVMPSLSFFEIIGFLQGHAISKSSSFQLRLISCFFDL